MKTKLQEHLEQIHGFQLMMSSPNALHEQDHLPGHGYEGHGWVHSVDDIFTRIDEEDEFEGLTAESDYTNG